MAAAESEIAAKLIERLLGDPAFRDRFRRDPVRACREAGLESLAAEMSLGGGKAMHTLDLRESRSSLAGVMMAAAMDHLVEVPGRVEIDAIAHEDIARTTVICGLRPGQKLRIVKFLAYGWSSLRSRPALRDQVAGALAGVR